MFIIPNPSEAIAGSLVVKSQEPASTEKSSLEIGSGEFQLGTLSQIRERSQNCPFCRLVIRSLEVQHEAFKKNVARDGVSVNDADENKAVCFASWQVDGRELLRDVKGKIIGDKPRTRRIRLRWDWDGFQDSYIVLMAPGHPWANTGLFLGRNVESARINPALVRSWVELCRNSHGEVCEHVDRQIERHNPFFGVIDVHDMYLTALPDGARYVALSYTWGDASRSFTTKKSNVQKLRQKNGLRAIELDLPRSIRDAIDLVRAIGERYLWIDALCIVQNSNRSWTLNSMVMDLVYGNACLTICAADGHNANSGLKALNPSNPNFKQNIERYSKDMRLMSTHPAETYIEKSIWVSQVRLQTDFSY